MTRTGRRRCKAVIMRAEAFRHNSVPNLIRSYQTPQTAGFTPGRLADPFDRATAAGQPEILARRRLMPQSALLRRVAPGYNRSMIESRKAPFWLTIVALGMALPLMPERFAAADDGLEKLFARREQNKAGDWRLLDQPHPGIVDADLKPLESLTHLESLSLAFAKKVTNDGLAHLKPLAELQALNLGGCRLLTDSGLKHISAKKTLETLNLSMTQVSDEGAELLLNSPNLRRLDLDNTSVTDDGLVSICRLTKLEYLRLSELSLSDGGIKRLAALDKISMLVLDGVPVTDASLETLASFTRLARLSLKGTRISADGAKKLREKNPKLMLTYGP
jgi:hypothetical protein